MTFRSVLVPLDGSPFGEYALPYALSLGRRTGAAVELIHVQDPVGPSDPPVGRTPAGEDRRPAEPARVYLADVARRVEAASPTVRVTTTLLHGSAADALCEHAARARPDLIVLTTHGRGPLSRFWLGSVTTELVQRAPDPLLLVRPKEGPPDLAADPAPGRILIPLDGSPFGEQILPLAVGFGTLTGATYRLLRVVPPVLMGGGDGLTPSAVGGRTVADELASDARTYLTALAGRTPELGAAETHVAVDWPPAVAILADADAHGADLIALETRGRSGLAKLLLGSVADKVVRGATVPVLLHRPSTG